MYEYHPLDFHKQISWAHCDKLFGYYLFKINDKRMKELKVEIKHEQERKMKTKMEAEKRLERMMKRTSSIDSVDSAQASRSSFCLNAQFRAATMHRVMTTMNELMRMMSSVGPALSSRMRQLFTMQISHMSTLRHTAYSYVLSLPSV